MKSSATIQVFFSVLFLLKGIVAELIDLTPSDNVVANSPPGLVLVDHEERQLMGGKGGKGMRRRRGKGCGGKGKKSLKTCAPTSSPTTAAPSVSAAPSSAKSAKSTKTRRNI